jgi:hypothetical protein
MPWTRFLAVLGMIMTQAALAARKHAETVSHPCTFKP